MLNVLLVDDEKLERVLPFQGLQLGGEWFSNCRRGGFWKRSVGIHGVPSCRHCCNRY